MEMTVFELRDPEGRRMAPDAILARSRVRGWLDYSRKTGVGAPEEHARLFGPDGRTELLPTLKHASILRISAGKIMLSGRYVNVATHAQHQQTWLCALDEDDGIAAVRALPGSRPPAPSVLGELPLNRAYYPGGVVPAESEAPFD